MVNFKVKPELLKRHAILYRQNLDTVQTDFYYWPLMYKRNVIGVNWHAIDIKSALILARRKANSDIVFATSITVSRLLMHK